MAFQAAPTPLSGLLVVEPAVHRDERGFFSESWRRDQFRELGIDTDFVQDNQSRSRRGVLRGLHWQDLSAPQGKLVRCVRGRIFDVAVDLRVSSPTFARWFGLELDDEGGRQLWVPPGFAHGFLVLSEVADVIYKCTSLYAAAAEGALCWDDPEVGVDWPGEAPILSAKDAAAPSLDDYRRRPAFP